ncbi:MAG TPA: adenylate cyclase regulatory domain-containing protein, partial [Mycobacterium sp.]|nr:adenylate cyclase regulatory domain-containing protein [Mycobacterium sp.]
MTGVNEPVRGSIQLVARLVPARVRDLARFGGDNLLAAVLDMLRGFTRDDQASGRTDDSGEPADGEEMSPAETVARGLFSGEGRYTRLQAAEQVGMSLDDARRLWRAVGFAEVGDDERVFTNADVATLKDVARLISAGILDIDGAVTLARPFGHVFSRLAAVQTDFLSQVLGNQIAEGEVTDDPLLDEHISAHAAEITSDLLPVLERVTVYLWRRHLAGEVGRAWLPATLPDDQADQLAAVGFIDICGFTRLSRGLDSAELTALL